MTKRQHIDELLFQIKALKLQDPDLEYRFHDIRRWRFDLAWPDKKVSVEIDGGIYVNGRHNRGVGIEKDCVKLGEAMKMGWQVYRTTYGLIKSGVAVTVIQTLLKQ